MIRNPSISYSPIFPWKPILTQRKLYSLTVLLWGLNMLERAQITNLLRPILIAFCKLKKDFNHTILTSSLPITVINNCIRSYIISLWLLTEQTMIQSNSPNIYRTLCVPKVIIFFNFQHSTSQYLWQEPLKSLWKHLWTDKSKHDIQWCELENVCLKINSIKKPHNLIINDMSATEFKSSLSIH